MNPWGFWATVGLSFCVWVVFVLVQTGVAIAALMVYSIQNPGADIEILAQQLVSNGLLLAIATVASAPVCIALIFLFIRLRHGATIANYLQLGQFNRTTVIKLLGWNLATVVFIYALDFFKSLLRRPEIPDFTTNIYETARFLPLLYLAIVVTAPLFEEIFFRGFMFQGFLHSRVGAIGAIVMTSATWAVIHSQYDPYDMTGIFFFGILLAIAQLHTRCLYVPITMHALNNFLALLTVAL